MVPSEVDHTNLETCRTYWLLFMDMHMPFTPIPLRGASAHCGGRAIRPDLPLLFVSGTQTLTFTCGIRAMSDLPSWIRPWGQFIGSSMFFLVEACG